MELIENLCSYIQHISLGRAHTSRVSLFMTFILNQYDILDLSHNLDETIPVWPRSTRFQRTLTLDYPQGCRTYDFTQAQGIGTHVDAPSHFFPEAQAIDAIPLSQLIVPAAVLDVRQQVEKNSDYQVSPNDLIVWENQFGRIRPGMLIIILTGWSARWSDESSYRNTDANGIMHFPGIAATMASLLVEKSVVGVGIDTLSVDCGYSENYPAHKLLLGAGKYLIENLTKIESLPRIGSSILVLPIKIKDAPEASARVVALIPKAPNKEKS